MTMAKSNFFYTVVEDFKGEISVCSFLGDTKKQEREYALTTNKRVLLVAETLDAARAFVRNMQTKAKESSSAT
jgi:hypothetical protein